VAVPESPPTPPAPLAPGAWLGVLGGGQLGRMFCMAAQTLGYRVCVLEPEEACPAGAVADRHIAAPYDDAGALDALAALCDAVTTEFENVPAPSLSRLAARCFVSPGADAVSIAQDRLQEKNFLRACGAGTAPFAAIADESDLAAAPAGIFPAILKTARLGYDGKGQVAVARPADLSAAWKSLGRVPCVLERRLALVRELSVVVARDAGGACAVFAVHENVHRNGILALSIAPARCDAGTAARAQAIALGVARSLDYVGVLCVELFELEGGEIVANEIAPRPHNSGHDTIEATSCSQFAQQARILAGLPLGDPAPLCTSVLLNLLGDLWTGSEATPDFARALAVPGACLHLYGKAQPRPGRKMGHLTVVAPGMESALARARAAAAALHLGDLVP